MRKNGLVSQTDTCVNGSGVIFTFVEFILQLNCFLLALFFSLSVKVTKGVVQLSFDTSTRKTNNNATFKKFEPFLQFGYKPPGISAIKICTFLLVNLQLSKLHSRCSVYSGFFFVCCSFVSIALSVELF